MASPEQTIRRLQERLKQKDRQVAREIARNDRIIDSLRNTLDDGDSLWEAAPGDRHGIETVLLYSRGMIRHMLNDDGGLAAMAGQDRDRFGHIY